MVFEGLTSYDDFVSTINESIHISLVLLFSCLIFATISILLLQRQRIDRVVALKRIPRSRISLPSRFFGHMQRFIHTETLREADIINSDPPIRIPAADGWGKPGSEYSRVHFKTSVAKSYLILEQAAVHADLRLSRPPGHSVRRYVQFLATNCGVRDECCEEYLSMYELARFTEHEVSFAQYQRFMANLMELVRQLEQDNDAG
ncbi:hypothetical protein J8273_5753 [Carpediemonas membranifera]|uniref:Defect at low temperature protein 1 n=1 Tax=Carpediemonas membranifera TaxID=201153 RepID=A0A8J6AVT6_9EUKA|nr:hypothetical protein J8273_5753 [Carpediemonas membranifera]|eukprot:KAG9392820.1 hypothetical protein J8273_5753 [Carpediemonas membranifera]